MPLSENIALVVFLVCACLQLFYYLGIYSRWFFLKTDHSTETKREVSTPVSVIICAKNEKENLETLLPLVLSQDYPEYEVIVVDDASWDGTDELLADLCKLYPQLKTTSVPESGSKGKKLALTLGIKKATYDHVLLTDADCKPSSANWIQLMANRFISTSELVLGLSPYQKEKGLLNKLIRFDAVVTALQYVSFALSGIPYMGVGRNMAYKKDLFFKVKGFKSHYHVLSGDDDLFVNEVATKKNTRIVTEKSSLMHSVPKRKWQDWFKQKKRHFLTSPHYKRKHKFLLSLYPASLVGLLLSAVFLFISKEWLPLIGIVLVFRLIIQIATYYRVTRITGDKDLFLLAPLYELVFLFLNPTLYFSNHIVKPSRWV